MSDGPFSAEPAGSTDYVKSGTPALVRQQHDYGCGVAALAMVTGQDYDAIHAYLIAECPSEDHSRAWLTERGLHDGLLHWFLARHGYVWRQVFLGWKWEPWPPEPFAPVHIAQVQQPSNNTHYVVMTADGIVLDPLTDEPRSLDEWEKVNNVLGIWPEPAR